MKPHNYSLLVGLLSSSSCYNKNVWKSSEKMTAFLSFPQLVCEGSNCFRNIYFTMQNYLWFLQASHLGGWVDHKHWDWSKVQFWNKPGCHHVTICDGIIRTCKITFLFIADVSDSRSWRSKFWQCCFDNVN